MSDAKALSGFVVVKIPDAIEPKAENECAESYASGWNACRNAVIVGAKQADWEPQFEAISSAQERLATQFCNEIAGKKGGKPSFPDPVRLLEMAEALYRAEREELFLGQR